MTAESEIKAPVADAQLEGNSPPSGAVRAREWFVPALLGIVLLLQLLISVRQLSQTSDEANHLNAGYRYWQCRDFGYNVEHPPLAKLVAALPLQFVTIRDPINPACGGYAGSDFQAGRQFLYAGDADRLLELGRAAESIFSLATLLLAWLWTRAMFGRVAAAIAATLLAFEPNLLAHGALITTDAALTFGVPASVASLWLWAKRPTWTRVVLMGAAVGVALASKFSAVIVIAIVLVLLAIELFSAKQHGGAAQKFARGLTTVIGGACIALLVVWATYGFHFAARPAGLPVPFSQTEWQAAAPRILPVLLKAHVFPQAYVVGLGHVLLQAKEAHPMFLFGRLYSSGAWFYFPAVLLIKLTLPLLLLVAVAVLSRWWRGRARNALYVIAPPVLFLAFAMRSKFDIGVRHVLPVIVFLTIMAGAAAAHWIERRRWATWAVGAALVFHIVTSVHGFPNYISYANELWGGPSGAYRQVTDSNTDWGQALRQVGRRASTAPTRCWVLSPYQIPLAYYGVLCRDLRVEPAERITGTVFVSSTAQSGTLAQESGYDPGETFRGRAPSWTVGGSAFLIYEGEFDLHTNLSLVYNTTAQLLLAQRRPREALEYAQHASQLRPDAGTPHFVACAAEVNAGAPDLAKHECAEAIQRLESNSDFNRRMLDAVRDFMRHNGL